MEIAAPLRSRFQLPHLQEKHMNAPIPSPQDKPALTDVKTLREAARRHIEEGAVTERYSADRAKVLELLNEALATELVCVLRYRHDYFMARGLASKAAADEFMEHATEELQHADQIAERIVQLGGEPRFNPNELTERSHSEYRVGKTLQEAIKENLVAERIAIDSYREMIQYIGDSDPTTRRMLEEILATEEEHADDLADLLDASSGGAGAPSAAEASAGR
jgi:bacterioferritin